MSYHDAIEYVFNRIVSYRENSGGNLELYLPAAPLTDHPGEAV
jgi:hypothetical protein